MKIAIVHDFLREYGGAERVVEAIHEIWPEAPVYTSFVDWPSFAKVPAGKAELFKSWDIRTSWVQHNWIMKKFHSPLRFLAPNVWESFDLSQYDVVITSSGWFMCRGVNAGRRISQGEALKKVPMQICYIHHPPRNLYGYATGSDLQKYWPVRVYATVINFFLRHYDFATAQKVDYFVANSKETARRVEKFYRRDSTIIYPPAAQAELAKALRAGPPKENGYFLSVGRLTYAKKLDVIIEACNRLKLPLKIVGKGKEEERLKEIAGPTIEFVGGVSDEELDKLYKGAKAFIFCALDEDFGIVPVEAMARGVPVIALAQGGVVETVIDKKTGILFNEPTVASLSQALKAFLGMKKDWSKDCTVQAEKFNKDRFKRELKLFVEKKYSRSA